MTLMLSTYACEAAKAFSDSDIEAAMAFCGKALPEFVGESNERLLKLGRSLRNLVDMQDHIPLQSCLETVLDECRFLLEPKPVKVPRVRFGKTNVDISVVTIGCMRFQQEWGPRINNMNMVGSDCQDNLVAILKKAILDYGINHIETARGYGCSELQLGVALKQLFATGLVKREDLIIQTKLPPYEKASDFLAGIEASFKNMQLDYFDFFAIHGMNYEEQLKWVFEGEDCCMKVVREYMDAGKIRHLGFSTHGPTELILKCIQTDAFEYVNIHYHYFGSYTASGGGHDGQGNLDCVKLLHEKGMGVFIISPFDKGGRMYQPSRKLRALTMPEMEPMTFGSLWLWNHHRLAPGLPQIHTYTVGVARPSDLDQPAFAAYLHSTQPERTLERLKVVMARLEQAKEKALGKEWMTTWWKGLPKSLQSKHLVEHNQLIWLYNLIKAFGLYEFAKARYTSFEKNGDKWDVALSPEENISQKVGKNSWGFVPGLPLEPGVDYSDDLVNVPEDNKSRVLEAEDFVFKWCRDRKRKLREPVNGIPTDDTTNGGHVDKHPKLDHETEEVPAEWKTAYDMKTWPDYPDQPSRA